MDWIDRFNYGRKIDPGDYASAREVVRTIEDMEVSVRRYEQVFPIDFVTYSRSFRAPDGEGAWEEAQIEVDELVGETLLEEWSEYCLEGWDDPVVMLSFDGEDARYEIVFRGDSYLGISGRLTTEAEDLYKGWRNQARS